MHVSSSSSTTLPVCDTALEARLQRQLYEEYVNNYVSIIKQLDNAEGFVRDDTFHGINSPVHIMYKYIIGKNGETYLESADGHRRYEFLVEFDCDNPEYGIYYGCKGLIMDGNQEEEINTLLSEWKLMEGEICSVLNRTFIDMDYSGRFQATNNASNRSFWPFWITLYAGEDVIGVAARATATIGRIYRRFISIGKECYQQIDNPAIKKHVLATRFTDDTFKQVLSEIKKNSKYSNADKMFRGFIREAKRNRYLVEDDRYEKGLMFCDLGKSEVVSLLRILSEKLGLTKIDINNTTKVSWTYFERLFMLPDGNDLSAAKQLNNYEQFRTVQKQKECKKKAEYIIDITVKVNPIPKLSQMM